MRRRLLPAAMSFAQQTPAIRRIAMGSRDKIAQQSLLMLWFCHANPSRYGDLGQNVLPRRRKIAPSGKFARNPRSRSPIRKPIRRIWEPARTRRTRSRLFLALLLLIGSAKLQNPSDAIYHDAVNALYNLDFSKAEK